MSQDKTKEEILADIVGVKVETIERFNIATVTVEQALISMDKFAKKHAQSLLTQKDKEIEALLNIVKANNMVVEELFEFFSINMDSTAKETTIQLLEINQSLLNPSNEK
jgi:hypothetical protein